MTSYFPKQIEEFIKSNPIVSLGTLKYSSQDSNGGCKELLINGNIISIIIPCGTRKLETSHRFRAILYISQQIYECLVPLAEYISESFGGNMRPFCWSHRKDNSYEVDYYVGAKLRTSREGDMYTRLYMKDGKEVHKNEWPTSFKGHVCINLEGVYINDMKSRNTKLSFVSTVEEILVNDITDSENISKIELILTSKETSDINIEDMW